jgi:DNA-binding MarR family transcriptional regulator
VPEPPTTDEWVFWHDWMQAHRMLTREVDRTLQRELGISKADLGVLVTLERASMRVTELAAVLDWEKGRAAHHLTRMEERGLVARDESGAAGRRTSIALTPAGHELAAQAILIHGDTVRRLALERLDPAQREAIRAWSAGLLAEAAVDA